LNDRDVGVFDPGGDHAVGVCCRPHELRHDHRCAGELSVT
jgi:hypothetical protein